MTGHENLKIVLGKPLLEKEFDAESGDSGKNFSRGLPYLFGVEQP